jgi:hypothetical protein
MRLNNLLFAFVLVSIVTSCNPNKEATELENSTLMECMETPVSVSDQKTSPSTNAPSSDEIIPEEENVLMDISPSTVQKYEKEAIQEKINKKKIIKDGSIDVKTKNVFDSKKRIDEIVKKLDAYYDKETFYNNANEISYILEIRIPANNFEPFISTIDQGENEIINKSIEARDVTEEWMDIETRLSNKKEYLNRYKELLSKAATIKDIIAIQENIRSLQEEIESSEGRLKYLSDQVSYSTLTIKLIDTKKQFSKARASETFTDRIKNSLVMGWSSVIDFLMWILANWPLILVLTVSTFFIRWIIKKRKLKKSK